MNPSVVRDITIEYRLAGEGWRAVRLSPREYFDDDGLERHDRALDYLEVDREQVEATRLTLVDAAGAAWESVTETLWDGGRSRLIERGIPGRPPKLVILDVRIPPDLRQVLRFERDPAEGERGALRQVHGSTYRLLPDGRQLELGAGGAP